MNTATHESPPKKETPPAGGKTNGGQSSSADSGYADGPTVSMFKNEGAQGMPPRYFQGSTVTGPVRASDARTFQDVVKQLRICPVLSITRKAFLALDKPKRNEKKRVAYFVPACFKKSPSQRVYTEATHCNLIFIDIDVEEDGTCPAVPFYNDPGSLYAALGEYNFAAYVTASSTREKPRMRIVVEANQIPVSFYSKAVATIGSLLGLTKLTTESKVAVQPMLVPTLFSDSGENEQPLIADWLNGRPFEQSDISDTVPAHTESKPIGDVGADALEFLEAPMPEVTLTIAEDALSKIDPDCVRGEWLDCAMALKHNFAPQQDTEAYTLFDEWSSQGAKYEGKNETRKLWSSLKQTPVGRDPITIRTLLRMANECGWEGKTGVRPVENSQSSDFPRPMAEAAFYGLAGEIVHLIEPHTEADPVALLIQFLVCFGNLIGRGAFIVADGARHYMNLFAVLVGLTSKGRKGTAEKQIQKVFDKLPDGGAWIVGRKKSGLSTGEGLIWDVRDAIEKANKEGIIEITDPGGADKRLMIVEGEFANTLKVMTREGNTLSPVIRRAWDGDILSILTKNSPAQATGAHISIIGHITREEARRLLNATEAANGFANRFLWPAVRRSKCLPEGGAIDAVDFSEQIEKLSKAIEFAINAGEIRRDEKARELWAKVYPELSEGKPGMSGAVTARAEAQVLRLSALFALLDATFIIGPEHHAAAMAVWDYCERSARWIFGSNTGNPHADRIATALGAAGDKGLTRTEISALFQKNLSSAVINDALETLRLAGNVVSRKKGGTGGAPVERWFTTDGSTK